MTEDKWQRRNKEFCERMGGTPEGDVCMVGSFPAPNTQDEWEHCAAILVQAFEDGHSIITQMSIKDADLAFPKLKTPSEESLRNLRSRYEKKKAVCPPWLEICRLIDKDEYFCTYGHEGRHRIQAAKDVGIKRIPVILRENPYECNKSRLGEVPESR